MFKHLNIPYCRKVLEFAENAHPGFRHNQYKFYGQYLRAGEAIVSIVGFKSESTECGTEACLAGIACILDDQSTILEGGEVPGYDLEYFPYVNGEPVAWDHHAAKLMGLTHFQGHLLFYDTANMAVRNPNEAATDLLRSWIDQAEKEQADVS